LDGSLFRTFRGGLIVSGRKNNNMRNWIVPLNTKNHNVDRHPNLSLIGPPIIGAYNQSNPELEVTIKGPIKGPI
jgi:hypothetical protein